MNKSDTEHRQCSDATDEDHHPGVADDPGPLVGVGDFSLPAAKHRREA